MAMKEISQPSSTSQTRSTCASQATSVASRESCAAVMQGGEQASRAGPDRLQPIAEGAEARGQKAVRRRKRRSDGDVEMADADVRAPELQGLSSLRVQC